MPPHCCRTITLLTAGLLVVSTLLVVGCSTPQEKYKVLSFFFDGVPNPDASRNLVRRQRNTGRPVYLHQPYAEQKCDSCHAKTQDIFSRIAVPAQKCFDCHTGVLTQYPKMHGPVASLQCGQCHSGHQSVEPHLLKAASPKVCVNCHLPETLSVETPEHLDAAADCIRCHSGHGGDDLRFLKPQPVPAPLLSPIAPVTHLESAEVAVE